MKKYFLAQSRAINMSASPEEIASYHRMVVIEMKKMGATPQEIDLLKNETILNSIRNNRKPEDVAWAILR